MPYEAGVSRWVSESALARLRDASGRLPKLAVAGEFNAGKSTLVNHLLGQALLPVTATASRMPPVWLRHGPALAWAEGPDGQRQALDLGQLHRAPAQCRCLHVTLPAPILRHCELLDLPGLSDPDRDEAQIHPLLTLAHLVVWCSAATQAWRQSERSLWLTLPQRLRQHSLLAVTRADKLESVQDRGKVLHRLRLQTAGLFADQLMLAPRLADAVPRLPNGATETNADPLWSALQPRLAALQAARAQLLQRYGVQEPPGPLLLTAEKAPQPGCDLVPDQAPLDHRVAEEFDLAAFQLSLQDPPAPAATPTATPAPDPADLPREVHLWRALVAGEALSAQNAQMAALFERYLLAVLAPHHQSQTEPRQKDG